MWTTISILISFCPLGFYQQLQRAVSSLGLQLQTETIQLDYPDGAGVGAGN